MRPMSPYAGSRGVRRRTGQKSLLGAASLALAALVLAPVAFTAGADTILTAAGNGTRGISGDGGQATEADLVQPRSVAPTREGGYVGEALLAPERRDGPDIASTQAVRRGGVTGLRLLVPGGQIDTENGVSFVALDHPDLPAAALIVRYASG